MITQPCRFCGSEQVEACVDSNNPSKSRARCRHCKATAPLALWNTPTIAETVAALREYCEYRKAHSACARDVLAILAGRVRWVGACSHCRQWFDFTTPGLKACKWGGCNGEVNAAGRRSMG